MKKNFFFFHFVKIYFILNYIHIYIVYFYIKMNKKYLISGFNEINVDDWKNNTDYEGYKKTDVTIVYFWRVKNIFYFFFF